MKSKTILKFGGSVRYFIMALLVTHGSMAFATTNDPEYCSRLAEKFNTMTTRLDEIAQVLRTSGAGEEALNANEATKSRLLEKFIQNAKEANCGYI